MPPRGRPPLGADKRSIRVIVKVSPSEHKRIRTQAKGANMPIANYLRMLCGIRDDAAKKGK